MKNSKKSTKSRTPAAGRLAVTVSKKSRVWTREERETQQRMDFCTGTVDLKRKVEQNFIEIGARLAAIRLQEMWKGQYEDFEHFCRDAMKMDEKTAFKLIKIFTVFVEQYKIEPQKLVEAGGWTYIDEILPVVTDARTAKEWLHTAAHSQSRANLRQLVREQRTGVDSIECKHRNVRTVTLEICEDCGDKHEVYV